MGTMSAAVTLSVAALFAAMGVLVRYYQTMELIAGYDPTAVTDEEGLARFFGRHLLYLAAISAVTATAVLVQPLGNTTIVWGVYTAVTVFVSLRLFLGARRYNVLA